MWKRISVHSAIRKLRPLRFVEPNERRGSAMRAHTPEEICTLFQHAMAEGDIDSVLSVYGREAVFVNKLGEMTKGWWSGSWK
jgi:hypothetical protein